MTREEKIVLKSVNKPDKENVNALSEWFCAALGFSTSDDTEPKLFERLALSSIQGEGITSKHLSQELKTPRSTIIYHLNEFISSGLVVRKGTRYFLRGNDLSTTFDEIRADMQREFDRMMQIASRFDEMMEGELYGRRKRKSEQH